MQFPAVGLVDLVAARMSTAVGTAATATKVAGYPAVDVQAALSLWNLSRQIPVVKGGVLPRNCTGTAAMTLEYATDVDKETKQRVTQCFDLRSAAPTTISTSFTDATPTFASRSGKHSVRFVKVAGADASARPSWRVEVWCGAAIVMNEPLDKFHGPPVTDALLQQVSWSRDEKCFVYVADVDVESRGGNKLWSGKESTRGAFETLPTWGEQFGEHSRWSVFLCDLEKRTIRNLIPDETFTNKFSACWPSLLNDGTVLFVGAPSSPRQLGILHCLTRENRVFRVGTAAGSTVVPSDVTWNPVSSLAKTNIRFLKLNPDGTSLACFRSASSGAHATCCALEVLDVATFTAKEVVPIVTVPPTPEAFPGLYPIAQGDLMWMDDGRHVLVASPRRSSQVVYCIDTQAREPAACIRPLGSGTGCWRLLDTTGSSVLLAHSATTSLPSVWCAQDVTTAASPAMQEVWSARPSWVGGDAALQNFLSSLRTECVALPASHHTEVLIHRVACGAGKEQQRRVSPAIVILHGGPHSVDSDSFAGDHVLLLDVWVHAGEHQLRRQSRVWTEVRGWASWEDRRE